MSVFNEKMTAIADAIRAKTGGTEKLGLDAIAGSVEDVYFKGKEDGINFEQEEFWYAYQKGGYRHDYSYAFAYWPKNLFKPKYWIDGNLDLAFYGFNYGDDNWSSFDLVERFAEYGVDLEIGHGSADRLFMYAWIGRVGVIRTGCDGQGVNGWDFYYTFANSKIHTIDAIYLFGEEYFTQTFKGATELVNIDFEGLIEHNIDFSDCPSLSDASIDSICRHLSEDAYQATLTVHPTVGAKLTDAQKATITAKNWTLVY